ncbi:hypothetical protein CIJ94_09035 [Escherichia coli]|nr:hypothetical protein CIJ96_18620 [Escherichia coli]OZX95830.1 hypothetical protein CIJ94_09035 [Escherichia coli]OZY04754.1 hypothetical protein CIJ91_07685 [Escherichia coli]OZY09105.1 hypothetical protein CIJ89_11935 [Escherichia coli]
MRTEFVYRHGVSPTIGQDRLPGWGQSINDSEVSVKPVAIHTSSELKFDIWEKNAPGRERKPVTSASNEGLTSGAAG